MGVQMGNVKAGTCLTLVLSMAGAIEAHLAVNAIEALTALDALD